MMNQDSTTNPANAICSICGEKEPLFVHNEWYENEVCRLCTSCILLRHRLSFCPGCLHVYDSAPPDDVIVCSRCHSFTHHKCNSSSIEPPLCAWCRDPTCLSFALGEVKPKGEDHSYLAIDLRRSKLLLAAAKISTIQMKEAAEAAQKVVEMRREEAGPAPKKAKEAINRAMDIAEREKMYQAESSRPRMEIDLNEGPQQLS